MPRLPFYYGNGKGVTLYVDGEKVGEFSGIKGITEEVDVDTYRGNRGNSSVIRRAPPGEATFTLEDNDEFFYEWFEKAVREQNKRAQMDAPLEAADEPAERKSPPPKLIKDKNGRVYQLVEEPEEKEVVPGPFDAVPRVLLPDEDDE